MKGSLQEALDDYFEVFYVDSWPNTLALILNWPDGQQTRVKLPETLSLHFDGYDWEDDSHTHELCSIVSVDVVKGRDIGYATMVKKGGAWHEFTTHGHREVSVEQAVRRGRQELVFYRKIVD